jgi:hypothetical protein
MKKFNYGSDEYKNNKLPPQPSFYLYYIRKRDMKNFNYGSDKYKNNKGPPQPYFYLY